MLEIQATLSGGGNDMQNVYQTTPEKTLGDTTGHGEISGVNYQGPRA